MNRTTLAYIVCATAIWIGLLTASYAPAPSPGERVVWQPSSKLLVRAVRPPASTDQLARSEH